MDFDQRFLIFSTRRKAFPVGHPQAETLAYLDGQGPKPPRFARVTMVTNSSVLEFKVGAVDFWGFSSDSTIIPPIYGDLGDG